MKFDRRLLNASTPAMWILSVLLAMAALVTHAQADVVLVEDGQPRGVIITAQRPSPSAERAAAELQHFIKKITGAELPIHTEDDPWLEAVTPDAIVYVGRSLAAADHVDELPAGDDALHSRERLRVKSDGQRIVVAVGNEDAEYRGTEYAVYELLEQLGCRWYFPGEFGEVLPATKTLVLPELDIDSSPDFAVRNIWMSGWTNRTADSNTWLLRNKGTLRVGFAFPGDGSIWRLAPMEEHLEKHPGLYAMKKDGSRQGLETPKHMQMLDTAYPEAVRIASDTVKAYFHANPNANSFAFSAPDGSPRSLAPEAVAADHRFMTDGGIDESISDAYFNFVNNLTHEVTAEFPDKFIVVLAYANRVRPPEGLDRPWHPNIIIHLARLRISAFKAIDDPRSIYSKRHLRTLNAWHRFGSPLLIYDYDPHADLSRMPLWRTGILGSDMRRYKDRGVIGFTTEGQENTLRLGMNYYIRARLMWDVNADVDALMEDYYSRFFGPATEPMKAVHTRIEAARDRTTDWMTWTSVILDWSTIYTDDLFAPADRGSSLPALMELAGTRAAGHEPFATRIAAFTAMTDYMVRLHQVMTLKRAGEFDQALAVLETLAETRTRATAIQPDLLPDDPQWVLNDQRGEAALRQHLAGMASRFGSSAAGGDDAAMGRRLALAPRFAGQPTGDSVVGQAGAVAESSAASAEQVEAGHDAATPAPFGFLTDPHNVGLFEQWQRGDVGGDMTWRPIDLTYDWTQQGYIDAEGYGYNGFGWYRFPLDLTGQDEASTKDALLYFPSVVCKDVWVWVNGHLVYSPADRDAQGDDPRAATPWRPWRQAVRRVHQMDIAVGHRLQPDAVNVVTVRMNGSTLRTEHAGMMSRPMLWAPATE